VNNADIICLQEVKAFSSQIPPEVRFHLTNYDYLWHQGTRAGYAGTAIFYRKGLAIQEAKSHFDEQCFHEDGRVTELSFVYQEKSFTLLNCYFPNGNPRSDGTEMLGYKLAFYECFRNYLNTLRSNGRALISTGDFNICHTEIDIARPKENEKSIGFLPIERAEMDKLVADKYVDVFRYFYPQLRDQYTRWSYRAESRPRNVGWRLDYFWVSEDVLPFVANIEHQTGVEGSDHCPILLELK
jgi:exodeoxyribonuclease-3